MCKNYTVALCSQPYFNRRNNSHGKNKSDIFLHFLLPQDGSFLYVPADDSNANIVCDYQEEQGGRDLFVSEVSSEVC